MGTSGAPNAPVPLMFWGVFWGFFAAPIRKGRAGPVGPSLKRGDKGTLGRVRKCSASDLVMTVLHLPCRLLARASSVPPQKPFLGEKVRESDRAEFRFDL